MFKLQRPFKLKKAGIFLKLLLLLIILAIALYLIIQVKADSFIEITNLTIKVNSSDMTLNISNSIYTFNVTSTVQLINIQYNSTINFNPIINNITTNITCSNSSIQVSCNCQPCSTANVSVNCSSPSEVSLNNETKELFFNHYQTQLKTKIEESSNKVAQDVLFRLEPTKAEFEECKQNTFNASLKQIEAERQRDQQASNNLALTNVVQGLQTEKRMLMIAGLSLILILVIIIVSVYGSDFFEKHGMMRGGSL